MYVREIEDQKLTLQVSGKLWMRSLVMRDVETKTEWSHLLGRGMKGPLEGKTLRPLVSDMVTWESWLQAHPKTTVLDMPSRAHGYNSAFYDMPDRFVYGFESGGDAWAIPFAEIQTKQVINFTIADESFVATFEEKGAAPRLFSSNLDGRTLRFELSESDRMKDDKTGSVWSIASGTALDGPLTGKSLRQHVGIMSFRKAWQNFHPESRDIEPESEN